MIADRMARTDWEAIDEEHGVLRRNDGVLVVSDGGQRLGSPTERRIFSTINVNCENGRVVMIWWIPSS